MVHSRSPGNRRLNPSAQPDNSIQTRRTSDVPRKDELGDLISRRRQFRTRSSLSFRSPKDPTRPPEAEQRGFSFPMHPKHCFWESLPSMPQELGFSLHECILCLFLTEI